MSARFASAFCLKNRCTGNRAPPEDAAFSGKSGKMPPTGPPILANFGRGLRARIKAPGFSSGTATPDKTSRARAGYIRPRATARGVHRRGLGGYNMGYRGGPTPRRTAGALILLPRAQGFSTAAPGNFLRVNIEKVTGTDRGQRSYFDARAKVGRLGTRAKLEWGVAKLTPGTRFSREMSW